MFRLTDCRIRKRITDKQTQCRGSDRKTILKLAEVENEEIRDADHYAGCI